MIKNNNSLKQPNERLTMPIAILALIVLAGSYVVNAMDRQVFPVILPTISDHFDFSLSQAGWLSTIFTLGIGVAGIPTGYLLDRFSRKSIVVCGILAFSVFTLMTALSVGFADMFIYRSASGIGEALQNAALFSAVGAYFFKRRALAIGTLNFAYGAGAFLGPFFGTKLLVSSTWHTPFIVYGLIGLAFAVAVIFGISKKFTEQKESNEDDSLIVPSSMPNKVWNRNLILSAVSAVVVGFSMYGYIGLYPQFLQDQLNFSTTAAGNCASMFGIGALMGIPAGLIGDKFNQKWVIIIALLCSMVVGYSLFNLIETPGMQALFSFLEGAFASGFLFTNTYSIMQRSVRPENIGKASGLFVTSLYLPSSIAGFVFAYLVSNVGYGGASLYQLVLFPIVGIVAMLFVNNKQILKVKTGSTKDQSVSEQV